MWKCNFNRFGSRELLTPTDKSQEKIFLSFSLSSLFL